ncbi:thioredoxin-like protein [Polychytrium aggregatum]|uniref:thioredoxin-like protein n=1 Tax=Polychytrium aggregatum TaxID=110093 RepID=UPI0022FDBAC5|nr:thioredoxin-like protein [Polychytrium aggregatum]KAI9205881.1 thioredoxin-like protein [Polychytrium aggregatum]
MKFSLTPVLVAVSALLAAVANGEVIALTPKTFDTVIDGSKPALVEFYAPWCGHCKQLAPIYDELGDLYEKYKDQVVIAKVDADAHRDLGSRFDIKGFPTLKWFPKGSTTPENYEGSRDVESFIKFIGDKTGVAPKIKTPETFVKALTASSFDEVVLKDDKTHVLVEFFAPWCGHCKNLAPIYEKLAKTFAPQTNVIIASVDATKEPALAQKYNIAGFPTIKFFSAADNEPVDYNGGRTEEDFVQFLNENTGSQRVAGGGLLSTAGRISALDSLARKFISAAKSERDTLIKEAQAEAKELKDKFANYYSKVMEKIQKAGSGYIQTETARLNKILASGSTTPEKRDDFTIRKNILAAFEEKETSDAREEL